jgi:hypothetical protein
LTTALVFFIATYTENARKLKVSYVNYPQIFLYMEVLKTSLEEIWMEVYFIEFPVARTDI